MKELTNEEKILVGKLWDTYHGIHSIAIHIHDKRNEKGVYYLPEQVAEELERKDRKNIKENGNMSKIQKGNYEETGAKIGCLVEKKNLAYGDSFNKSGEILKILYPDGIKLEDYGTVLAIIRILDKLFRIATDKNAFGEDPWKDIAGYSILAIGGEKENDT